MLLLLLLIQVEGLNVAFKLFNSRNPSIAVNFDKDNKLDLNLPTKIIIPDFTESDPLAFSPLAKALLKQEDSNVVLVDWSKNNPVLHQMKYYAEQLGILLGEHLNFYFDNFNKIHYIGFGVGAHIAGYTAKRAASISEGKGKVRRITGLDPFRPFFNGSSPEGRLDKSDADIVDVVHCDGGRLGLMESIGTIDFYPNGGVGLQPGPPANVDILEIFHQRMEDVFCSHSKCGNYFLRSIGNPQWTAVRCNSYQDYIKGSCNGNQRVAFGDDVELNATGTFYFNTTNSPPE